MSTAPHRAATASPHRVCPRLALLAVPVLVLTGCTSDGTSEGAPSPSAPSFTAQETNTAAPTSPAASAPTASAPTWTMPSSVPPVPTTAPKNETGAAGTPRGLDAWVRSADQKNAARLTQAVALTMFAVDCRIDRTPTDAYRRAQHWWTPKVREQYINDAHSTDATFVNLCTAGGFTRTAIVPGSDVELTKPTKTSFGQTIDITSTPQINGQSGAPTTHSVTVYLGRKTDKEPWRVTFLMDTDNT